MVKSSMENILEGKEDNSRMTQKVGPNQLERWNYHSLSWEYFRRNQFGIEDDQEFCFGL